ncbi:MAG: hypothetical protein NC300_09170 [Bacteroidales bacterium]|nr:hypothetical protein [Clostridium sp.]MCM1204300.1 hypothetical protein [Bacteroidales bacterium]
MKEYERLFLERRPVICKNCGGKLFYRSGGAYECEDCGLEELDDFGKIKRYLDEYGVSTSYDVSEATGVPMSIINMFLKEGRLEIPEGSRIYIKCERCGCSLRYGRFCYGCTKELSGQLQGALYENMGEEPKNAERREEGKMHFLDNSGGVKKKR